MLGIHPGHADEWNSETARELRRLVTTGIPVAIGEIGLDFYRGETNVVEQVAAFTDQLSMAREFGLPVSIHMRNAEEMVIDVLNTQPRLPVLLFHSFEGSERLVNWILHHEAYIGVGGLATRKKSSALRTNIQRVGLDRIVLETDSPYLVPNGFKHRRNTPESIPFILRSVANLFGVDETVVANRTTETACRIFRSLPQL
jgi:TatD DNase family protein